MLRWISSAFWPPINTSEVQSQITRFFLISRSKRCSRTVSSTSSMINEQGSVLTKNAINPKIQTTCESSPSMSSLITFPAKVSWTQCGLEMTKIWHILRNNWVVYLGTKKIPCSQRFTYQVNEVAAVAGCEPRTSVRVTLWFLSSAVLGRATYWLTPPIRSYVNEFVSNVFTLSYSWSSRPNPSPRPT